jgi:hypothetical protein
MGTYQEAQSRIAMQRSKGHRCLSDEERNALQERLQIDPVQADYLARQRVNLKNIKALSQQETSKLRQEWERVYIPPHEKQVPLHKCSFCRQGTGSTKYESFNWHAFSYGLFPSTKIDDSDLHDERKQFLDSLQIRDQRLVLMWESCGYKALEAPTEVVRQFVFDADLYLFPRSLEWTFVSTHEPMSFYAKRAGLLA